MKLRSPCMVCDSSQAALIGLHPDFRDLQVVQCSGCGTVFTEPSPTPEFLSLAYASEYRQIRNETPSETYLANMRRRARAQREFTVAGSGRSFDKARILDVGCGAGELLGMFGDVSDSLFGFEPDSVMCAVARERLGTSASIYNQMLDTTLVEGHLFDLIMASHVLEHVINPVQFLADMLNLLTRDGLLFLEVPNTPLNRVRECTRYGAAGSMHLWFFEMKTLRRIVNHAGGRVISSATFGPSVSTFPAVHAMQRGLAGRAEWLAHLGLSKVSRGRIGLRSILSSEINWERDCDMKAGNEGIWMRLLIERGNSGG